MAGPVPALRRLEHAGRDGRRAAADALPGASRGTASAVRALASVEARATTRACRPASRNSTACSAAGWSPGGVVLLGGDPGIGKSTLLLQAMAAIGAARRALYVTGEESVEQVALRAQRLGLVNAPVELLAEVQLEAIVGAITHAAARGRRHRLDPDGLHRGAGVGAGQRRAGARMRGAADAARQAERHRRRSSSAT